MDNVSSTYYYHPVDGSRELVTRAGDAVEELKMFENSTGDDPIELEFNGERLWKRPPSDVAPGNILKELEGLDATQQAVFVHLYLSASAAGTNWIRMGMTELCGRTRLSRRRLLRVLSGLVDLGRLKPLDRTTDGTLYILYSVLNIDNVQPGIRKRPQKHGGGRPRANKFIEREKPIESPINEESFPVAGKVLSIRKLAETFFESAGVKFDDVQMDEAIAQITYLLEDGYTREETLTAIKHLTGKRGAKARISQLPYIINEAIGEDQ